MSAAPLRGNRSYRLLWIGGAASALGSHASAIAMPMLVLALGGSATEAGVVGFAAGLPYLLAQLPAGVLVDRLDRRAVMVFCDVGRFLALGSIVVALTAGRPPLAQLVVVAFVEGVLTVGHQLAEQAAIRHVVSQEQLPEALSANEARIRGALLLGQPVGGALFGFARWLPFAFDLVTYLVSIVTSLALRGTFRAVPAAGEPAPNPLAELRAGIAWLWRQPFLRSAVLAIAASNLLFQSLNLIVIVAATGDGASPGAIGLLFLGAGAGGVAGSLAAPKITRLLSMKTVVIGANWLWAALMPLIAVVDGPLALGLTFGVLCFVGPVWNVAVAAYQLRITPEHLLGRVGSAIGTLAFGVLPLGSLLAGWLLDGIGVTGAALTLAGVMAIVAAVVTLTPAIRRAPELDAGPESGPEPVPDRSLQPSGDLER
ncbi:MFS transporter [Nonomuraea sp. NPDC052129]|uniref:MFS transporter n=1 Tax=Nonomuraea sp. NPDC052129 TaxID=3154651 RepID=UPI00343DA643